MMQLPLVCVTAMCVLSTVRVVVGCVWATRARSRSSSPRPLLFVCEQFSREEGGSSRI
jgi:hypothetical protein